MRKAGMMLPLTALPARHGVGDMGAEAHRFIDMLRESGARYWQVLPIHPLGYGNSPYQPYSSYAGDPLLISLDALWEEGLLAARAPAFREGAEQVAYGDTRAFKEPYFREAFARFVPDGEYDAFIKRAWVKPYAVFMALKRHNGMRAWNTWPKAQKDWPEERALDLAPFDEAIRYELFLQYIFHTQWMRLKQAANQRGVEIIGDMPIYVGLDSADVWANRRSFLLDEDGEAAYVAGVPPDYFSADGQRWGNPIYDWDSMQADGFTFWVERLRYSISLFDVIRIDHFRGFDTYWEIPASCPTAVEGIWREAPGYALFDTVMREIPGIRIIAEDLGMLRDEVYTLRDHYHFRGMKILQFTFAPGKRPDPQAGGGHMVAYTGTHDNQTMMGWYRAQGFLRRILSRRSLAMAGFRRGSVAQRFVRLALADIADMAIIPAQDVMGLDDRARINTPGTVGPPNWEWELASFDALAAGLQFFRTAIKESGRG